MRIWVGIPAYDGKVCISTARSLTSEIQLSAMHGHNIKVTYLPGCSIITHARNQLVQQFLDDPWKADKMVFIDSDVGWEPGSLMKLATYNKDVIAGIYRFKIPEESYPMGFFTKKGEAEIEEGLITVAGCPMGFTAISRNAFERFREHYPERAYEFLGVKTHCFFENPFVPESPKLPASLVGEDVAFGFKWREMGGKIWVDPNMNLVHSNGLTEYGGNLLEYLRSKGAEVTFGDNPASAAA